MVGSSGPTRQPSTNVSQLCKNDTLARACRDPLTPLSLFERTVRVFSEKTALVYEQERWTYSRLAEEIGRLGGALIHPAVEPADRVAFLAPNVPALLVAHFAVLQIQATLVAISTHLSADEVGCILNYCCAKIVFADPELAGLVTGGSTPLVRSPPLVNVEDPMAGVTEHPLDGSEFTEFLDGADVPSVASEIDNESNQTLQARTTEWP